jgi:hypothetical protein
MLEALHARLGHGRRCVAVVELRQPRRVRQELEALLEELVVADLRLVVDRKLAEDLVHLRLRFRLGEESQEFFRVGDVFSVRRDMDRIGRRVLGVGDARIDRRELDEADLILLEAGILHHVDGEIAHQVHRRLALGEERHGILPVERRGVVDEVAGLYQFGPMLEHLFDLGIGVGHLAGGQIHVELVAVRPEVEIVEPAGRRP